MFQYATRVHTFLQSLSSPPLPLSSSFSLSLSALSPPPTPSPFSPRTQHTHKAVTDLTNSEEVSSLLRTRASSLIVSLSPHNDTPIPSSHTVRTPQRVRTRSGGRGGTQRGLGAVQEREKEGGGWGEADWASPASESCGENSQKSAL